MKILYFDCIAGASGDMLLGALVDLGVPSEYIATHLTTLNLSGYKLKFSKVLEHSLSVTRCDVIVEAENHVHRHLTDIIALVETSDLSEQVKTRSKQMFFRLGQIEAGIHQQPLEKVHFHEVGALDSIIDIIGCNIAFEYLQVDRFVASPLPVGWGSVQCAHGRFPIPAPATLGLLQGVPVHSGNNEGEVLTPTGALIITSLAEEFSPMPTFNILSFGYGVGHKKLDSPNIIRLVLGETSRNQTSFLTSEHDNLSALDHDSVIVIEANIDDQNPEQLGLLSSLLLSAGALDVSITPALMKKGRPGQLLQVICPIDSKPEMLKTILSQTSSIGVRFYPADRVKLPRLHKEVNTSVGPIRVKIAGFPKELLSVSGNFAPEYEDCMQAATAYKVPLKAVYREALRLALECYGDQHIDQLG